MIGFTTSLVGSAQEAEDILQEASMVMWAKFDQFQPGTDFTAWAFAILRIKVMEWRRKQKRNPILDDGLLQIVADEAIELAATREAESRALSKCMEQLRPEQRDMVQMRYRPGGTLKATAIAVGKSHVTARKYIKQILHQLMQCVQKRLATEVRP